MLHYQSRRLSAEEEARLARVYAETQDAAARDALVGSVLPLVQVYARRAWRRAPKLDINDLVQEGVVGLLRGLRKFDPSRGTRLSTYATYWVRVALDIFILQNGRATQMQKTKTTRMLYSRLRATHNRREAAGLPTDPEALAQELGLPVATIIDYTLWFAHDAASLDAVHASDRLGRGVTLGERLPSPAATSVETVELAQKIAVEIDVFQRGLRAVERDVFLGRIATINDDPPTLVSIGNAHGFTKQGIGMMERTLRTRFAEHLRSRGLAPAG